MKSDEKEKKRNIIVILSIICSLVLVGILTTYSYLSAPPKIRNEEVKVNAGDLKLIFEDNDSGINKRLAVEETVTKKFILENKGSVDAHINFDWINLINTYIYGSLVYKLSYSTSEDGEYTDVIFNTNVPVSSEKLRKVLAENVLIPAKSKYYFNLDIKLQNLENIDQTSDFDSYFQAQIVIGEVE